MSSFPRRQVARVEAILLQRANPVDDHPLVGDAEKDAVRRATAQSEGELADA